MALNPFHFYSKSASGPALSSFPITPADGTDLATDIRAITLNAGGTLSWVSTDNTVQTTAALPAARPPSTSAASTRRIKEQRNTH